MPIHRKPSLFLVGAMKSGSSTLASYLHAHPSIYMSRQPKEPSYFLTRNQLIDVYPAIEKMSIYTDEKRYLSLFDGAPPDVILGEASQNYARLNRVKGIPERIYSFCPEARILYIMRDPVLRTISHYWYMVNLYGEGRPMLRAIQQDPDYQDTSHYAMQIRPYLNLFGPKNVMILTLEDMKESPVETMKKIYSWLEVDADFVIPQAEKRNVTPDNISTSRGFGILHSLRHSAIWDGIGHYVPRFLRKTARAMAEKSVKRNEIPTDAVEAYLRPIQELQTKNLEGLLDRKFTNWKCLRP